MHYSALICPFKKLSVLYLLKFSDSCFVYFFCYWRGGFSRVSVIRGGVALQDGSPLVGVNITFPQHPEYGYSISRKDGR